MKYVTPDQRHRGQANTLLQQRAQVYQLAREKNPQRWSGETRDWTLGSTVYLNPERAQMQEKEYMKAA